MGVLQARDVAQLNLANAKGKKSFGLSPSSFCCCLSAYLIPELHFSIVDNLRQVSSERDSTSTRVAELEAQLLSLREEVASAKRETAAALARAENAESREEAASKQEEELTPRVQALVNSLSGECSNFSCLVNSLIVCQC